MNGPRTNDGLRPQKAVSNLSLLKGLINKKRKKRSSKTQKPLALDSPEDYDIVDNFNICGCAHCNDDNNNNSLETWKNILAEREKIGEKIMRLTHKKPADLLFNRPATIDYPDQSMMYRMLKYAEKMNPNHQLAEVVKSGARLTKPLNKYPYRFSPKMRRHFGFEISGIPGAVKHEMLGKSDQINSFQLYQSPVTELLIKKHKKNIKNVVEFFPDIDNLVVIGVKIEKPPNYVRALDCEEPHIKKRLEKSTRSLFNYIQQLKNERKARQAAQIEHSAADKAQNKILCACCRFDVPASCSDSSVQMNPPESTQKIVHSPIN